MNVLTSEKIESLFSRFTDSTLSKTEWTHDTHLIVAMLLVKRFGIHEAICKLKAGIILLNKFHGTVNDAQHGYHETLTIFWTSIINIFIGINPDTTTEEELINEFLHCNLSEREFPFVFYEREKLMSPEHRAVYVEPMLKLTPDTIVLMRQRVKNM